MATANDCTSKTHSIHTLYSIQLCTSFECTEHICITWICFLSFFSNIWIPFDCSLKLHKQIVYIGLNLYMTWIDSDGPVNGRYIKLDEYWIVMCKVNVCLFSFHLPRYGRSMEYAVSVIKGLDYWSLANKSIAVFFILTMLMAQNWFKNRSFTLYSLNFK